MKTSNGAIPRIKAAREWFAEADRTFAAEHQGCPCCRNRHCVFRARWGCRTEYHCNECDFSAAHDDADGSFCVTLGQAGGKPFALEAAEE